MAAAREEGVFEVVIMDANRVTQEVVKKIDTVIQMPPLAESNPTERPFLEYGLGRSINEDEHVALYFTSKANDNVVAINSKIAIPITVLNISPAGNKVSSAVLGATDFDDWNSAGTTGIPVVAGKRALLGEYTIHAKQIIKLGDRTAQGLDKNNGRLLMVAYDDTA